MIYISDKGIVGARPGTTLDGEGVTLFYVFKQHGSIFGRLYEREYYYTESKIFIPIYIQAS